jgi:site-specific DNA-methyltransferase (adenine-specific)
MIHRALYASRSEDWETPQNLYDRLDAIFAFALDACATAANAKARAYFRRADDALNQDWAPYGRIWLNPPYGRRIGDWMAKAYAESCKGALIVALVPARTDTRWWHASVSGKALVTFLPGRLKFLRDGKALAPAPFPSALIFYAPNLDALMAARA